MHFPNAAGLLSLAILVASPPIAAAEARVDRWEKSYPIANRPALHLTTDDGNLRLHTWSKREVLVKITTQGWRIGRSGVRIEERQAGDRVDLEVRTPSWEFNFGLLNRSLHIEVWVPAEADLALITGDGNVVVPGARGRINVRTGDGAITVQGARGDLRLRSGDGRITASGIDGVLDAHTGDGGLRVDGRFDGLTLNSGDGNIVAEALPGSRVRSGWSLYTGDGRVTMRVPADLKADVEARTGDGAIDIDLPLAVSGRVSRHHVRGTLNGGGPLLRLRSGDGSIRLTNR